GQSYNGEWAKNKKDAEQSAALSALTKIQGPVAGSTQG
ncbi:hypothetical protein EBX93_09115, partial [bacterium]|nr:hypothetical protein [bacterium]